MLDPENKILDTKFLRLLIYGLCPGYLVYVVAIPYWENQPSIDKLENLLISHEMMLVKVGTLKIEDEEEAMFFLRVPSQNNIANPKVTH